MDENVRTVLVAGALLASLLWNLYQTFRFKSQDVQATVREIEAIKSDVESLKFKVGLFWRLVEDHMSTLLAKANPIHLTLDEQVAARVYDVQKRNSPTGVLKTLAPAIKRELPNLTADEKLIFVCILGAIESQLYDRGELEGLGGLDESV